MNPSPLSIAPLKATQYALHACLRCGNKTSITKEQVFKNGATHLREECSNCGRFIKYHKQDKNSFADRCFAMVKRLAHSDISNPEVVDRLQVEAINLIQLTLNDVNK